MVTVLLIILVFILFSMLTGKQQRNFISGLFTGAVESAGFLIKATFWIGGLFAAPFFAFIALSSDSKTLGLIFAMVGFVAWAYLIDKLKEKKESKND